MILHIAKRRFLSNIITMRFTVSFILCVVLFAISTVILLQDYAERQEEYSTTKQAVEDSFTQQLVFSELSVVALRPPTPLSVICEGAEKRLGVAFDVGHDKSPTIAEERATKNPLLAVFPSLDIVTIIEIIISLLVVFMAYNVISGEREAGTLKLMLSNSLPRHTVLAGNFIGSMASVLIPLLIGFIVSLIIVQINPSIAFSGQDYVGVFILLILAVVFLSAIFSIGMFLSSRIRSSATVLIIMLAIWVFTVIILPQTAVYFARQTVEVPDKASVDRQAQLLRDEWVAEMDAYANDHPNPQRDILRTMAQEFSQDEVMFLQRAERHRRVYTGKWPYAMRYFFGPREMVEWYFDGSIYGHNLRMDYEDRILRLYQDYQIKLEKQAAVARALSLISPSWTFKHAVSDYAGTGEKEYIRFLDAVVQYRSDLVRYIKNAGGLDSYRLFTKKPVEEFPTARELVRIHNSGGDNAISAIADYTPEPLDLSDMPRFSLAKANPVNSLIAIAPEIGILVFIALFFFLSAWVSFLRADVR